MRPMLASRGDRVPTGPGWVHEVKWDGMRVIATVRDGQLRLESRNGNDVTVSFPELQPLAQACGARDLVLDGEVVAFLDGVPRFGGLADRMHVKDRRRAEAAAERNPVTLLVFDLLAIDGLDITSLPLKDRRAALEQLDIDGPRWQVPPTYDDGELLLRVTAEQGLEGIVSKRLSSAYRPGQRSEDWRKFPHRPSASYVVGGWRPETGSATRLGAVLVGEPTADGLVYRGRVGSGLAGTASERVKALLDPLAAEEQPFVGEVPKEDVVGTHWLRPEVVVEVASLGLTPQQRLRQPAFLGVRQDLEPADLLVLEPTDGPTDA